MHATIRRYESIDQSRKSELVKKVDENLVPTLSELPGFNGYSVIDAGNGVMTSVGFFDTAAQADESTRVAGGWLREQKLDDGAPARRRRSRAATSSCTRHVSSSRPNSLQHFSGTEKARTRGPSPRCGQAGSASRTVSRTHTRKQPVMALKQPRTQRARTVGHISHDARVRVDQRVKEILARRDAEVERARRAAARLIGW